MELFTLENITISRDWLTPIGVALVLLSFSTDGDRSKISPCHPHDNEVFS